MLLNRYIGDVTDEGGIPLQPEASAYFKRMTSPPSEAFAAAVNWAIYRWKAIGAWSEIKGLWILAAETAQAARLSVIGDTPRDAVTVGTAPTFTALKGYSGFDATHQVKFPITATILASDNVFAFLAARTSLKTDNTDPENPVVVDGCIIKSDGGTAANVPGNFTYEGPGGGTKPGMWGAGVTAPFAPACSVVVGGSRGPKGFLGGAITFPDGSGFTGARSSNYITTAIAYHPLDRLSAYGFLASTASDALCRRFVGVLTELLEQLGALD